MATLAAFALFTACERPEPEPEPPTPPMVNPDTLPTNKFIGVGATIYRNQGDTVGAGNSFDHAIVSSFYNGGSQSILYSYSSGNTLYVPYNPYNITTYSHSTENTCSSTLCDNGGTPKSRADFQSDKDASTGSTQPLSDTYHTAAQPIADPYSLTETRFMEGYAELFTADADDAEMANYADFHALKLALRDNIGGTDSASGASKQDGQNSSLETEGGAPMVQIAQLQTIAERNTGRASVMAKGVLCFFYGICYEDKWDNAGAFDTSQPGDTAGTCAKRTAMDNPDDATLTVYPYPTDDVLFVELRGGSGIANIALYDLQGRMVGANNHSPLQGGTTTINMKSIPAGVYVLRVTDADGKEYHQKIVRK